MIVERRVSSASLVLKQAFGVDRGLPIRNLGAAGVCCGLADLICSQLFVVVPVVGCVRPSFRCKWRPLGRVGVNRCPG